MISGLGVSTKALVLLFSARHGELKAAIHIRGPGFTDIASLLLATSLSFMHKEGTVDNS